MAAVPHGGAEWGDFFYCTSCVPSALAGDPMLVDKGLTAVACGVRGRFSCVKALRRHIRGHSCRPVETGHVVEIDAVFYCSRCHPCVARGVVPGGVGRVGRFSRRGLAENHVRGCRGSTSDIPLLDFNLEGGFWRMSGVNMTEYQGVEASTAQVREFGADTPVGGCASCGVIVLDKGGSVHMVNEQRVRTQFAYPEGVRPPNGSARGVISNRCASEGGAMLLRLIADLIFEDARERKFLLCQACDRDLQNGRETKLGWSLDLGRIELPNLSLAEKAAIAQVRAYGFTVKVEGTAAGCAFNLRGHVISFDQDVCRLGVGAAFVFPRTDVSQVIRVQFIGGLSEWNRSGILSLKQEESSPLRLRRWVIGAWLGFLKTTHPMYADATVDSSEARFNEVERDMEEIYASAIVCQDSVTRELNEMMRSDIAENPEPLADGGQKDGCLFSTVVLQNQDPLYDERRRLHEAAQYIRVPAGDAPVNEFDENEQLLSGAFPWVFPLGFKGRVAQEMRFLLVSQFNERLAREDNLLYVLFNQMQRHRVTHNIARASEEDIARIEMLRVAENLEERLKDALSDDPSEDGKAIRKILLNSVHRAEKKVPFSRTEMDQAFVSLLAMLRFFACAMFFVTAAPTVIDSAFGLKICCGVLGQETAEYTVRSRLVFETPARAAIYFQFIMDHIEKHIIVVDGRSPGVFGRVKAYSRTNECQGRTLLHAHMLIWTDVTPELIQQLYREGAAGAEGAERLLKEIYGFLERTCTTTMDDEFHKWSEEHWARCERPAHPGLGPVEVNPFWSITHRDQLHLRHMFTCWKKYDGKEKPTDKCRMGMPAGLWPGQTQLIQLSCVKKDRGTEVVAPVEDPDPEEIPCTHVRACECKTFEDLAFVPEYPCTVEITRPRERDKYLTTYTREIMQQTWSNSNTCAITTEQQGAAMAIYCIKYNSKAKTGLSGSVAPVFAAIKKVSEKTTATTERTFWNCFVNAAASNQEVPATMAAFALLGGRGFTTSCKFWYVFIWDCLPKSGGGGGLRAATDCDVAAALLDLGALSEDIAPVNEDMRDHALNYAAYQTEAAYGTEDCSSHRTFDADGELVSVSQQQIYMARPTTLECMSFCAFCCMYDVRPRDNDDANVANQRNTRYTMQPTVAIHASHVLFERTRPFPVPVLAGTPPPMLPVRIDTAHGRKHFRTWASYWAALLIPWRAQADIEEYDKQPELMLQWLLSGLRGERGPVEKTRALFVHSVSVKWRRVRAHAALHAAWRFRNADTRRNAGASAERPQGEVEEELRQRINREDLLRGIFLLALNGEDSSIRARVVQMARLYPVGRSVGRCSVAAGAFALGAADADRVVREIASYGDAVPVLGHAVAAGGAPGAGGQQHVVQPLPELNAGQNRLYISVLQALAGSDQLLLFVQGEAGTGKSFVIRKIAEMAAIIFPHLGTNAVRCASPTGVAAENLLPGTTTLHRGFVLNFLNTGSNSDPLKGPSKDAFFLRFRGTRVFIIDEISMVMTGNFVRVSERLRELASTEKGRYERQGDPFARQLSSLKPFGGFHVIVIGDFRQIPPVGSKSLLGAALGFRGKDAIAGKLWREFRMLALDEQCRANEPVQRQRVETLRSGRITADLLDGIAVLTGEEAVADFADATFIVRTNRERAAINDVRAIWFAQRAGKPVLRWRNELRGAMIGDLGDELAKDVAMRVPELATMFVEGAPGMVLRNLNPQCGLSNGSYCTMVGLTGLSGADLQRVSEAAPGEIVDLEAPPKHVLVSVLALATTADIPRLVTAGGVHCVPLPIESDEVTIGGQRIPYRSHHVTMAFAVTMHKVQGKTLGRAVICLSNHGGGRWKPTFEEFLVAITRVRAAGDLRLLESLSLSDRRFHSLATLVPDFEIGQWLAGTFSEDGWRDYADCEDVPPQQRPAPLSGAKRQRERTVARVDQAVESIFGEVPVHTAIDERPENYLPDISTPGCYIRDEVVTFVCKHAKGVDRDTVYLTELEVATLHQLPPRFVTYLHFSGHFVCAVVDDGVVSIFDSARDFTAHHLEDRARAVATLATAMRTRGVGVRSLLEIPCTQQGRGQNDCGLHTIRNALVAMVPGFDPRSLTRAVLAKGWARMWRIGAQPRTDAQRGGDAERE